MALPNNICLIWILFTLQIFVAGISVIFDVSFVPNKLKLLFAYGKSAQQNNNRLKSYFKIIELPKKFFLHYYVFGTVVFAVIEWSLLQVFVYHKPVPFVIEYLIDLTAGKNRVYTFVDPKSVIIANTLMLIHVLVRGFETFKYFVFSDTKINILHYVVGLGYYLIAGLSVICETPFNTSKNQGENITIVSASLTNHILGISLFIIFSYVQFKSHLILSNLRRDKKGKVVTLKHSIPTGGLFHLVSSPHYFAEIIIYLSICLIISGQNNTWWGVCLFVLTNQIIFAILNHRWYQNNFPDYPKHRKAVIPFIL